MVILPIDLTKLRLIRDERCSRQPLPPSQFEDRPSIDEQPIRRLPAGYVGHNNVPKSGHLRMDETSGVDLVATGDSGASDASRCGRRGISISPWGSIRREDLVEAAEPTNRSTELENRSNEPVETDRTAGTTRTTDRDRLVSVVVPTYGRPEFVSDAVESITAQTYDRVELLLVDDHSPEPVAPVLERIDTSALVRAECIRHEENRGANAARNTGIRASEGDVVAFLDDDDRWLPTIVERYVETFRERGPDVGLVSVGTRVVNDDGEQIGRHLPDFDGDSLEVLLDGELVGSFSRFAVRRWAIEASGLPDERLPAWQDWEWQFRLARHCQFASVPEPLMVRVRGSHDQITDDFEDRRDVSYRVLLDRHREAIARGRGERAAHRFVGLLSRTLAASALGDGRYLTAVRYLLRSLRHDPVHPTTLLYLGVALGGPVTNRFGRLIKRRLSGVW